MARSSSRTSLLFAWAFALASACEADPLAVPILEDGGSDVPIVVADASVWVPPIDVPDPDAGTSNPLPDAGSIPMDAGTRPMDAGTTPMDAGTRPMDAGTPAMDAGTPPPATSIVPPRRIVLEQPGVIDTLRALQDRSFNHSPFQSTGYWVRSGDALRISLTVTGAAPSRLPEIWIHSIDDDTWNYSGDQKVVLRSGGTVDITASLQGIVYVSTFNEPTGGVMTVDFVSGGRPMPRFLGNAHTNAQWTEMLSTYSSSPYAELVGKRMMVTSSLGQARTNVDDPTALMRLWDEIVRLEDEQYGLVAGNAYPHAPDPHRYHFVELAPYDGWMYAWQYRMAAATAAVPAVLNAVELRTDGWGPWHELGHQHQMDSMTWDDQTEVTVNLSSAYVQRALGVASRFETSGDYTDAFAYLNQSTRSFAAQDDPFIRAIMFWQLDLTFGRDFYAKLARNLRNVPRANRPSTSDATIQHFIVESSRVAGYNLSPFFTQWGVPIASATRTTLGTMGLRTLTDPIWQNRDTNVRYRLTPAP